MMRRGIFPNQHKMSVSESEYESSYADSEYSGTGSGSTEETNGTFASFYHAIDTIFEQLEEFEAGVESVHATAQKMEQPVTGVAVGSFVQPAFLKAAPFRQERFRWTEEAKTLFGQEAESASFAEICATIRTYLFENGLVQTGGMIDLGLEEAEDLKAILDIEDTTITFVGILVHLDKFVQ
jgi:hypothetical protein